MNAVPLFAVNNNGGAAMLAVLEPFCATVYPALAERADTIKIAAKLAQADMPEVIFRYKKGEAWVPLSPAKDFHPFVTSSRIRLLSGMSISPTQEQAGTMRLRFLDRDLVVDVQVVVQDGWEIVTLKPNWDEQSSMGKQQN